MHRLPVLKSLCRREQLSGLCRVSVLTRQLKYEVPGVPASARMLSATKTVCRSDDSAMDIAYTSVFLQDGLQIQELPCIVRLMHGEFVHLSGGKMERAAIFDGLGLEKISEVQKIAIKSINVQEENEMVLGFKRCSSILEVFLLLNNCPEDEITAPVALAIITKIIQLNNAREFHNRYDANYLEKNEEYEESRYSARTVTFTRAAVMESLLAIICKSGDAHVIIDTFRTLLKEYRKGDEMEYLSSVCNQIMVLVTENKLTVKQIVEIAKGLDMLGRFGKVYSDKLWIGLEHRIDDLTAEEVCNVISMLPYVKKSRNYIFSLVERRAVNIWCQFKVEEVIQIVSILVTCHYSSYRLLSAISRWTNVNMHAITGGNFRWILVAFTKLQFIDDNMEKAVIRYCKAKKSKMTDPSVVAAIMDFCSTLRFRNSDVLEICSNFFIENAHTLTIPDISSICRPFGYLNYLPKDHFAFFKVLENILETNFVKYPPDMFLDLLLTCIYLERYPLNFVKKIFHPLFFHRIECLQPVDIHDTLAKVKLLDKALSLEAPCYAGPMLPRSKAANRWLYRDARIMRTIKNTHKIMVEIAGSAEKVTNSTVLLGFPQNELYKIDCLIDMSDDDSAVLSMMSANEEKFAFLIHVPEHYDMSQKHLVGPQAMRVRHLRLAGVKVVSLDYTVLSKYYNFPSKAKTYILEEMTKVT